MSCLIAAVIAVIGAVISGVHISHMATRTGLLVSLILSIVTFIYTALGNLFLGSVVVWETIVGLTFKIGFLVDQLSALLAVVVTSSSLLLLKFWPGFRFRSSYSEYDDTPIVRYNPHYLLRFYSYLPLFTFAMLITILADNLAQIFVGWMVCFLMAFFPLAMRFFDSNSDVRANEGEGVFFLFRFGVFGFIVAIATVGFLFLMLFNHLVARLP